MRRNTITIIQSVALLFEMLSVTHVAYSVRERRRRRALKSARDDDVHTTVLSRLDCGDGDADDDSQQRVWAGWRGSWQQHPRPIGSFVGPPASLPVRPTVSRPPAQQPRRRWLTAHDRPNEPTTVRRPSSTLPLPPLAAFPFPSNSAAFYVHASLLRSSTVLRSLPEAAFPTPDNRRPSGAARCDAAGDDPSAAAAAGCKSTANRPLRADWRARRTPNPRTSRQTSFRALPTLE